MSEKKNVRGGEKSSPDYPFLARRIVEASRDEAASKLLPGLYVVATPIGNLGDISLRALATLAQVDRIACEDTRHSGVLFARYGLKKPLISYHDHNADKVRPRLLMQLAAGARVALVSDAGMPLVADPGFKLVRACRDAGHPVIVVPGANAALTALVGAGLPMEQFHFAGFLPARPAARQQAIEALEPVSSTLVFYEAPQRLAEMLIDLEKILGNARTAIVARELTKLFEETRRGTLGELAAHYRAHPVKGEIVVMVAPPDRKTAAADMAAVDEALKENLRTQSLRDAVASASAATGMRKGEVYARALWLRGKPGK